MLIYPSRGKNASSINKFLDFDKYKKVFYDNLYLSKEKLVVKIPIVQKGKNKKKPKEVKISKFDLGKYTYLLAYE